MPEISRFLGIVIYMYFNEHNPPHFHAEYNEFKAAISIQTLGVTEGKLPSKGIESCRLSGHRNIRKNYLRIGTVLKKLENIKR
ncbi:MAG: DUF4160 domain-containing protein [Planctomycetota bacterium]|jgi:hypothetical protein